MSTRWESSSMRRRSIIALGFCVVVGSFTVGRWMQRVSERVPPHDPRATAVCRSDWGRQIAEFGFREGRDYATLSDEAVYDPEPVGPGGRKDTHMYFLFEGELAKALAEFLTEQDESLLVEGAVRKWAPYSPLRCEVRLSDGSASCTFSIDLRDGTLGPGFPC